MKYFSTMEDYKIYYEVTKDYEGVKVVEVRFESSKGIAIYTMNCNSSGPYFRLLKERKGLTDEDLDTVLDLLLRQEKRIWEFTEEVE